jgi:phosphatidylglycerophosphate synthase
VPVAGSGVQRDDDNRLAWRRFSPRPLTAGERWTALELETLRHRRYAPRAWGAFLRHSLTRAAETRRARPQLARQSRRWGVIGAVGWLAAREITRRAAPDEIELPALPGLAWWLSIWQMLDWHLGEAEGGDGVPRERLGHADAVTLMRFWLVPTLAGARRPRVLALLIALGGATDALDGRLARRDGRTRLGRDLDTFADLAFLGTATVVAHRDGRLTTLGATAIATRYTVGLTIACRAVFVHARRPAIRARPWGAAMRTTGLFIAVAGAPRTGSMILIAGSLIPPRNTTHNHETRFRGETSISR